VDDDVQAQPVAPKLHRQRVDEERHVVRDHLDDGVLAGEAVLVVVR
jgi:hypothetical protein